jgi:hypothetical protein
MVHWWEASSLWPVKGVLWTGYMDRVKIGQSKFNFVHVAIPVSGH